MGVAPTKNRGLSLEVALVSSPNIIIVTNIIIVAKIANKQV